MFQGLFDSSIGQMILYTLITTHITIVGVTVFLHRHQAHRALDLHPIPSHFFRFWLWLTTGMVTREWVAIHRKHHAKCETPEDPHSPQIKGIKKVLFEGAELYREESTNQETLEHFGKGTPNDWLENHLYSRFPSLGITILFVLDFAMFGFAGLTIWAIQMIWIPFWAAGVINGVGHYWGYRNYECADASRNVFPWGILIGGEELHNNHHTYASSAKLSSKWWEFDIGWMYIRILAFLRLAKIRRVAPKPVTTHTAHAINTDTVTALVQNRFQIMARYSKEVIATVNREVLKRAEKKEVRLLKKANKVLTREETLMDEYSQTLLQAILEKYQELKTVYQFKRGLQELCSNKNRLTPDSLIKQVQDWCKQAEESGIQALERFAAQLKSYAPQTV